ncbi:MAG: hypothetical protein DRO89_01140 [Candidatus Altiarchaeales archaeon]|nr:MAG: hypothetical protein DRO89_01140 [Candidatus Altiarchaeales archaeon]
MARFPSIFRETGRSTIFIGGKKGIENRVIVLPGLRGVGKTTLMLQIYKYLYLTKQIEQDRILYFSAVDELKEYLGAKISEVIGVYVESVFKIILIDEAHFDKPCKKG